MSYFYNYLVIVGLELPLLLFFYAKATGQLNLKKVVAITVLINAFTHPLMFFGIMGVGLSYLMGLFLSAVMMIVGEMLLHMFSGRLKAGPSFHISLLSNLFSWQIAPVCTYIFFYS